MCGAGRGTGRRARPLLLRRLGSVEEERTTLRAQHAVAEMEGMAPRAQVAEKMLLQRAPAV